MGGPYQNLAVADIDGVVAESEENNNTARDTYGVGTPATLMTSTITSLPAVGTLSGITATSDGAMVAITTVPTDLTTTFVTYTSPMSVGTASFEYSITDTSTGLTSALASVALTITEVIDLCLANGREVDCSGPTADSQTVITNSQSSLVITLTASDPAGEELTFSVPNPPDPGAPAKGTLSGLTPIVPAPIPHREPPPATVQPPVTSATVTYTPSSPSANEEDSFTFTVANPGGLTHTAAVTINPLDTSPPAPALSAVDATDVSVETATNTATALSLSAGGPDTVTLTFRVETLPSGALTDSSSQQIQNPGTDLPDAKLTYTPPAGVTGTASFTFSARDSATGPAPCSAPSCDTAAVNIDIGDPSGLAEDRQVTTNLNQPVLVTLTGNPSGAASGGADTDGGGGTPAGNGLVITVLTLPSDGTLTALNGTPVSVMQTFSDVAELVYTPDAGFSGTDSFSYKVAEGAVIGNAILGVTVLANEDCVQAGRETGCSLP